MTDTKTKTSLVVRTELSRFQHVGDGYEVGLLGELILRDGQTMVAVYAPGKWHSVTVE